MIKADAMSTDLYEANAREVKNWIPLMLEQDPLGRSAESTKLGRMFSWWTLIRNFGETPEARRRPFTKRGYWQEILSDGEPFAFVNTDVTSTGDVIVRGSGISRVVPRVHSAFDWLEKNERLQEDLHLVRLIATPEFYLHSFWISSETELILPIDPEGSHLRASLRSESLYTLDEFIDAARAAVEKARRESLSRRPD